jgi:hypothetical protein
MGKRRRPSPSLARPLPGKEPDPGTAWIPQSPCSVTHARVGLLLPQRGRPYLVTAILAPVTDHHSQGSMDSNASRQEHAPEVLRVMRCSLVLLCVALVGCGGAAQSVRHAPDAQRSCVYVPSRDEADRAWKEEASSARAGVHVVLVAAAGASPVVPPASSPAPAFEGLSGEGLGNGIPRGVLRLVPEGGAAAAVGAGGAAGEAVVVGGAFVAAVGSGLLVCLTARAALDGEKTPIDIADGYYGTHFGDVKGWVQGQYPDVASQPGPAPGLKPDENTRKRLGRIYVTYTKLNKMTRRYYAGRTSMIIDLAAPLRLQAAVAVLLRERNHHLDENSEPEQTNFTPARVDRFDAGGALDYSRRYDDVAYWRIRGREQQMIDSLGGLTVTPESLIAPRMPCAAWRKTIHGGAGSTPPPRNRGGNFTLTRDTKNAANLQTWLVLENTSRRWHFRLRPGTQGTA